MVTDPNGAKIRIYRGKSLAGPSEVIRRSFPHQRERIDADVELLGFREVLAKSSILDLILAPFLPGPVLAVPAHLARLSKVVEWPLFVLPIRAFAPWCS